MARTIERSEKMDAVQTFRCTPKDKAQLQLAAQKGGTNVTYIIRQALIKEGILEPW